MKRRNKAFICITLLLFFVFSLSVSTMAKEISLPIENYSLVLDKTNDLSKTILSVNNDSQSLVWLIIVLAIVLLATMCFLAYVLSIKFNAIRDKKTLSFTPLSLLFLAYSEGQIGAIIVLASVIIILLAIIVFIIIFDDSVQNKLFSKKVKEDVKLKEKKEEVKVKPKPEEKKEELKVESKPEEKKEEVKEDSKSKEVKSKTKLDDNKDLKDKEDVNEESTKKNHIVEVKENPVVEVKTHPIVEVKENPVLIIKEEDDTNDDEDEVEIVKENNVTYKIRYQKSFKAKLSLADDETRNYYNILKNEILSYKKTTTRISFAYDSINTGKNQLLKFVIRGKSLILYYSLNPKDFIDSKYKIEESTSKKYELVPCMYKITSERRLNYAKELMAKLALKFNLEKEDIETKDYLVSKEDKESLIEKGLIKVLKTKVESK